MNGRTAFGLRTVAASLAAAALAGCEADQTELQAWMDETRRTTPTVIENIAQPKKFEAFAYQAGDAIDPFSLAKMRVDTAMVAGRPSGGLSPDVERRREPLEAFPLDTMKMVGNLRQGSLEVALVQVDAVVYQVRVGNYVGRNFGRVLRISENEVSIRETVQDATGAWTERDTALPLQAQAQETRK